MSWKDIDNPHKKKIDKDFVSCDERYGKEKNHLQIQYQQKSLNSSYGIKI